MIKHHRRSFLHAVAVGSAGASAAALFSSVFASPAAALPIFGQEADQLSQIRIEEAWAFFRSLYDDADQGDVAGFLSHYLNSNEFVFQDAIVGQNIVGYAAFSGAFSQFLSVATSMLGAGRSQKVFKVSGDLRYGAVVEHVFLKNVFFSTNGFTTQSVIDMDGLLVARNTDYWDSRELGAADIVGPAATAGVAFPSGAVHPGGVPRSAPVSVPPRQITLATGVTGRPSASPALLEIVTRLSNALRRGNVQEILRLFADDAVYVNPLIHQGPPLYGNFDQTIQLRGKPSIFRFFSVVANLLPDCHNSTLIHVVGGDSGGGFEWKAGGLYTSTGLERTGLAGCSALDVFDGRITRMSVKFDTFQMPDNLYRIVRSVLLQAGVVDQ